MKEQPSILDVLRERPLMFDGAMGTVLYERGVFVNVCYDEVCLTRPDLVRSIHEDYAQAGCDVIETNTFGANRIKLAGFGLADKVADINCAAVRLAREAAGDDIFVAGSVGPCLLPGQNVADRDGDELRAAFAEQVRALLDAGVDLLAFETFTAFDELELALDAVAGVSIPVLASCVPVPSPEGVTGPCVPEAHLMALDNHTDVDLVGLNCGVGPAQMLSAFQHARQHIHKPIIVMPNAGGPDEVGGRALYFNSPEYFTEYAKRFVDMGARGVGGCCGTTPDIIRTAVRAVHALSGVTKHVTIIARAETVEDESVPPIPLAEKSGFAKHLATGRVVTSVEMLPPRSGDGLDRFVAKGVQCREAGVDAINIPDGPRASARLSVLVAAWRLQQEAGIAAIPHYCCRDRNLIAMQADLLGGVVMGIRNWLFITGDPPKLGDYPDATGVFDVDAIGLARLVNNLNRGVDAVGHRVGSAAGMLVGVGANPVAVDLDREIDRFFAKIDAGAEFAITQPVFDADALLRFLDRTAQHDRTIPVLAGLYPLLSLRNAEFMNDHVPGVVVPDTVLTRMAACTTREDGLKMGIEICREMADRIKGHVAGFQASAPLGKVEAALAVLDGYYGA